MFPNEIWKECFGGASKNQLKILCIVCRQFAHIFQPLLFEHFKTEPRAIMIDLPFEGQTIRESVAQYFKHDTQRRFGNRWHDHVARYIRARQRFLLVSAHDRLAHCVRKCTIRGGNSTGKAPTPVIPSCLGTLIIMEHQTAISSIQSCLTGFTNLCHLKLSDFFITPDTLRVIEQLPRLQELTLIGCHPSQAPVNFAAPLQLIKVKLCMFSLKALVKESADNPPWATWAAGLIPKRSIQTLLLDDWSYLLDIQAYRILPALRDLGPLPLLTTLSVPLPHIGPWRTRYSLR